MKEYYIYKIICLCGEWNGKFYIGKHYGDIHDNYTGCGRLIKEYFKKYGKVLDKTYVKEIIDYGDENSICDLERDYIRKYMESELCLNMICHSGIGYFRQKHSDEAKRKISESLKCRTGENNPMYGKKHSEETRRKISEANKRRWNKK